MYITGGIGSLPIIEGFGRDFELDNEFSYSETCAAIGSIYWNREMTALCSHAKYADLVERQLYNAALVGISQDGKKYFYRNPLESRGDLERQHWFKTACCPSNISRLWADIPELIYHETATALYIDQYIGSEARFSAKDVDIKIESAFPWQGQVKISVRNRRKLTLNLRIPGWADRWEIKANHEIVSSEYKQESKNPYTLMTQNALYKAVMLEPKEDNVICLDLPMSILKNTADQRVKTNRSQIALSRGPIVYCLESEDELTEAINVKDLHFEMDKIVFDESIGVLKNNTAIFIPYFIWGNRGKRRMKVWFYAES